MRKLTSFNFVTLNGFYKDAQEGIGWHQHGGEEAAFSADSLKPGNILLFGRITYEQMKSFWPTAAAAEHFPEVSKGMTDAEKIVFSRTLRSPGWNNARLISNQLAEEVKKLKQLPGKDLTILGSGSIIRQLTDVQLIDTYQVMIDPIAIGQGTPLFENISTNLLLKLVNTRVFKSGTVLLTYERA